MFCNKHWCTPSIATETITRWHLENFSQLLFQHDIENLKFVEIHDISALKRIELV